MICFVQALWMWFGKSIPSFKGEQRCGLLLFKVSDTQKIRPYLLVSKHPWLLSYLLQHHSLATSLTLVHLTDNKLGKQGGKKSNPVNVINICLLTKLFMRELTWVELMAGIIFTREKILPNCWDAATPTRFQNSLPAAVLRLDARLMPMGSSHGSVLICINHPDSSESAFVPAGQVHR